MTDTSDVVGGLGDAADSPLSVPVPTTPSGPYRGVVAANGLLFVSGQPAKEGGQPVGLGAFGDGVDEARLAQCAHACALNVLAQLSSLPDGLGSVAGILSSKIFVAVGQDRPIPPSVAAAVGRVFAAAFGTEGVGAVTVVGVPALPNGTPTVVEAIAHQSGDSA